MAAISTTKNDCINKRAGSSFSENNDCVINSILFYCYRYYSHTLMRGVSFCLRVSACWAVCLSEKELDNCIVDLPQSGLADLLGVSSRTD